MVSLITESCPVVVICYLLPAASSRVSSTMRLAPSLLLLFLAPGPARVRGCDTGLLLLGGYNTDGPVTAPPQLLTSSGWCQDVRLPPLPDTLDSPAAAYVKGSVVVACGFSSSPHCR